MTFTEEILNGKLHFLCSEFHRYDFSDFMGDLHVDKIVDDQIIPPQERYLVPI